VFRRITAILACFGCALLAGFAAHGATVFESTELAGVDAAADAALPAAQEFQVTAAGSYTVSLTDLQTPALLQSLRAVITRDLQVVAEVEVTYPVAPALPGAAAKDFMATPGTYRVHVLGAARQGEAGGGFGLKVAPAGGGTSLLDHVDVIAAQSAPAIGQSASQASFAIAQAGSYQLTLTDHAFPAPLASLQALLLQDTDSGPVVVPVTAGAFDAATPGTFELVIVATADSTSLAGLYGVRVAAGPNIVYRSTQPVGNLPPATAVNVQTAGQYTLTLGDAKFPATLSSLAARVTQSDTILAGVDAAGTAAVTAATGSVQIYTRAVPATAEGVGAYQVQLANAQQTLLADIRTADASPDPASAAIYSFAPSAAITAGSYQLKLEDLAFPAQFTSLNAALVQGVTVLGTVNSAQTATFTAQSGPVKVLVAAKAPAAGGNSLFGVTLISTAAGAANVIESTQGVGGLFRTSTVTIATAGPYDLTLADLEFPARLATAQLAITRGTTLIAQIIGSGTVSRQQLAAGTYVLNFIGQPAAAEKYGTYGLKVAESTPQPTVTLTATSATITSGQSAILQWTSADATTCTASNGWSGTKSASGTETVGPLNASATFALSCTGPGGTGTASQSVTVSAPSASSGGGGGACNLYLLAALSVLLLVAQFRGGKGRARSH
jgi:hypothetical protein